MEQLLLMAVLLAILAYVVWVGVEDSRIHNAEPARIETFKVVRVEDAYPVTSPSRPPLGLTLDDLTVVESAY